MIKKSLEPITIGILALGLAGTAHQMYSETERANEQKKQLEELKSNVANALTVDQNPLWNNKYSIAGGLIGYKLAPEFLPNINPNISSIGGAIAGSLLGHSLDKKELS